MLVSDANWVYAVLASRGCRVQIRIGRYMNFAIRGPTERNVRFYFACIRLEACSFECV